MYYFYLNISSILEVQSQFSCQTDKGYTKVENI